MANFAGTLAETYFRAAAGPSPGILEFTYTLSTTTYVDAGTIDISALKVPIDVAQVISIDWSVESSAAAYMCVYTPAGTPALNSLGTLSLFTATGSKATGNLTCVVRGRALLSGPRGVMAKIV